MSHYFSEVVFRPSVSAAPTDYRELARLKSDPDAQHKALWRLFPRPPGSARPFLYRERRETAAVDQQCARFWMVSDQPPLSTDERWQVRSKPYSPVFRAGQQLAFELRIAPSVTRVDSRRLPKPGKQVPRSSRFDPVAAAVAALPPAERAAERQRWVDTELAAWLQPVAVRHGFTWSDPRCVSVVRYEPVVQERGERGTLRFSTADFRGELDVTDPQLFAQAALQGIGHQRSFGCGLLLLRPARNPHDDAED